MAALGILWTALPLCGLQLEFYGPHFYPSLYMFDYELTPAFMLSRIAIVTYNYLVPNVNDLYYH